ncbi:MAG TPA: DUF2079 domain-containing protein, partial [Candidatus Dormibacteraeota bacterium]|nr:DUF2079 domain-containing protein [Candidatus Dormibacteraeota bacterium]
MAVTEPPKASIRTTGPWQQLGVILAALIAFAWYGTVLLRRAEALQSRAFDQAFFQQLAWNIGHGHGFVTNFAPGNALAVHFSPFLALVAIPDLLWTDPRMLSLLNAAGLAAAGPAAFLFLRTLLPDAPLGRALALATGVSLPFWPAIQEAARSDFHPESLALPIALLAATAGLSGRRRTFWILALTTLSIKEDQVYTLVVVGLVVASRNGSLKADGRRLIAVAIAWGVAVFIVVMPLLALLSAPPGQAQLLTASYYGWIAHSNPGAVISAFLRPEAWERLGVLLLCVGALPVLRPRWAVLILPPFLADLMSSHYPQMILHFHYGLLLIVPTVSAAGMGAAWLLHGSQNRRPEAGPLGAWPALAVLPLGLLAGILLGGMPPALGSSNPPPTTSSALLQLQRCALAIPAGSAVAADDNLGPPLASRQRLVEITSARPTDYVAVDVQAAPPGWIDLEARRAILAGLPHQRLLACSDGPIQIWAPSAT